MKKLFTLCASALLACTLSAQSVDNVSAGTWFVGAGDATSLLNLFSDDGAGAITPSLGYAVQDNMVVTAEVQGAIGGGEDLDNVWNLSVDYVKDGYWLGVSINDAMEAGEGERSFDMHVSKMFMVGAISDRMYVMPGIAFDLDFNMNSQINFGFMF